MDIVKKFKLPALKNVLSTHWRGPCRTPSCTAWPTAQWSMPSTAPSYTTADRGWGCEESNSDCQVRVTNRMKFNLFISRPLGTFLNTMPSKCKVKLAPKQLIFLKSSNYQPFKEKLEKQEPAIPAVPLTHCMEFSSTWFLSPAPTPPG